MLFCSMLMPFFELRSDQPKANLRSNLLKETPMRFFFTSVVFFLAVVGQRGCW
jgi:hypothetical protein